ncbi:MAG: hypothetical protein GXP31_09405 [Kiritimatiellaeota bacterium]|nr:hypothetical protein [Kiritimatiellota bacterium]
MNFCNRKNPRASAASVLAFLIAALVFCSLYGAEPERTADVNGGVILDYQDLTGDGIPEIVLENEYLRIEIMTGKKVEAKRDSLGRTLAGLLGSQGKAPKPRYDTRFVWAGWINNITFKPSGQRWFANDSVHQWHGIPEEFGQAVKMRRTGRNEFEVIKVGIGTCTGKGISHHSSLKLLKAFPWDRVVRTTERGGKRVLFRQKLSTELGYGYLLEKEFLLEPGRSELLIRRRLKNTGREPLHTTWYTHAFWAQAAGNAAGYDADSWTTIPIRYRGNGPRAGIVDTASCIPDRPRGTGVWGAIPADLLAESWYASGNRKTGDVFLTRLDTPLAWDRVWTYESTYSCEPFVVIDLDPGQEKTWTMVRTVGVGLTGVRGAGPEAVLNWRFARKADRNGRWPLTVQCLTADLRGGLTLSLQVTPAANKNAKGPGAPQQQAPVVCGVPLCGPTAPFERVLPGPSVPGLYLVRAILKDRSAVLADVSRVCEVGPGAVTPELSVSAFPAAATVFTGAVPDAKTGRITPSRAAAYVGNALRAAGFQVRFANPTASGKAERLWNVSRVAVLADVPRVPGYLVGWLESFVKSGNGLVMCAPLDLRPFEFSELLPVSHVTANVNLAAPRPRDGTREFIGDSLERYHLAAVRDHPIIQGLPLYPEVYQDIARLSLVEMKPTGTAVLRYAPGSLVRPRVSTPALIVGRYGAGRVAVFTSPVDWGLPAYWVLYSRLGEYHRKLLAQMGLWAGGFLDGRASASR